MYMPPLSHQRKDYRLNFLKRLKMWAQVPAPLVTPVFLFLQVCGISQSRDFPGGRKRWSACLPGVIVLAELQPCLLLYKDLPIFSSSMVFSRRLSRLQDMSGAQPSCSPAPPDSGSHSLLVPLSLDMQVSGDLGGDSQAPGKWAVPRCGHAQRLLAAQCEPSSPAGSTPGQRVVTPLPLGGCSRACAAGGCAGVSPPPPPQEAEGWGVPEGWGCRT